MSFGKKIIGNVCKRNNNIQAIRKREVFVTGDNKVADDVGEDEVDVGEEDVVKEFGPKP